MKKLRVHWTIDMPIEAITKDGHTVEAAIAAFSVMRNELREDCPDEATITMRTEMIERVAIVIASHK